jgi:hypothetical protein
MSSPAERSESEAPRVLLHFCGKSGKEKKNKRKSVMKSDK